MTQEKQLDDVLREFERVGVDPNTVSAGLAIDRDELMRALSSLPDAAGPTSFLAKLRSLATGHELPDSARRHAAGGTDSPADRGEARPGA